MSEAFDVLIIGSGFGGSVSALRLAEKGYRVAVLEQDTFLFNGTLGENIALGKPRKPFLSTSMPKRPPKKWPSPIMWMAAFQP